MSGCRKHKQRPVSPRLVTAEYYEAGKPFSVLHYLPCSHGFADNCDSSQGKNNAEDAVAEHMPKVKKKSNIL
jgi:hypothetical protein